MSHPQGSKFVLIRNGFDVFLNSYLHVNHNFVVGDSVTLDHKDTGKDSMSFLKNSIDNSSALPSETQLFIPIRNTHVAIGGKNTPHSTNVSLKLEYTGSRSDEPDFSVGDVIRIKCPGFVLEPHSESIKIAKNITSINKWKKRENKAGKENKYIDDSKALWLVNREVKEDANPKFTYSLQTTLTPWLSMLDVVKVQDEYLNPNSLAHEEVGYISTISYDLNTRGLQTITVRGILPY